MKRSQGEIFAGSDCPRIKGRLEELQKQPVNSEMLVYYRGVIDEKFPKKCQKCGEIYPDLKSFWEQTTKPSAGDFLADYSYLQLHRNCQCSSTLAVIVPKARDDSQLGDQRRAVFDNCVEILAETMTDLEPAINNLKSVFANDMYQKSIRALMESN